MSEKCFCSAKDFINKKLQENEDGCVLGCSFSVCNINFGVSTRFKQVFNGRKVNCCCEDRAAVPREGNGANLLCWLVATFSSLMQQQRPAQEENKQTYIFSSSYE